MMRRFLARLLGPLFVLLIPLNALAADYQLQVGALANQTPYQFSTLSDAVGWSGTDVYGDISQAYGYHLAFLWEQEEFYEDTLYSYGASHFRIQGNGNGNFMFMDAYEGLVEAFWGDKERVLQKRPFWEKLWVRAGVSLGIYRMMLSPNDSGTLTTAIEGAAINSFGYTYSYYLGVGLGRLGSLEYTSRTHKSGSADVTSLNNTYMSYVYHWDF